MTNNVFPLPISQSVEILRAHLVRPFRHSSSIEVHHVAADLGFAVLHSASGILVRRGSLVLLAVKLKLVRKKYLPRV